MGFCIFYSFFFISLISFFVLLVFAGPFSMYDTQSIRLKEIDAILEKCDFHAPFVLAVRVLLFGDW